MSSSMPWCGCLNPYTEKVSKVASLDGSKDNQQVVLAVATRLADGDYTLYACHDSLGAKYGVY